MVDLATSLPAALQKGQSIALIVNGAIHDYERIRSLIQPYDAVVAVDGGLIHCHALNLHPQLIIGDLDSINPILLEKYRGVPIQKYPVEKDETDLELAIRTVYHSEVKKIALFGALERRIDHALANLHVMRRFPDCVVIETENETVFALKGSKRISCHPGQTVSLIPLGPSPRGVTTKGLKWELHDATLDKNFFSLSNISLSSEFEITIAEGDLVCMLKREPFPLTQRKS